MAISAPHEVVHESRCVHSRERKKSPEVQQLSAELVADRESPDQRDRAAKQHVIVWDICPAVYMTKESRWQCIIASHSVQQARGA
jgi:hypothetical protein